jgi:hypothetical protein
MSGSFIAKNISVGTVNLGEWSIKQDNDDKLLFNHNNITQMSIAKGTDVVQNQTSEPELSISGTLKLNEPIIVTKTDLTSNNVTLSILFNEAAFQNKADAFGFKLAYSDVSDIYCEVFYKDYSFGKASQFENVFLTKEILKNPLFFRFNYSKVPNSIACLLYPSKQTSEAGGGLVESVPFGIKFKEPVAPRSVMMDFTTIPTTSSTAGGTVNPDATILHGLVQVDNKNLGVSAIEYGGIFSQNSSKKIAEQTPTQKCEFLAKLVDRNGVFDINNITVRFYQFRSNEIKDNFADNYKFAHENYGNRIYKTTSINNNYTSLSNIPTYNRHEDVILTNITVEGFRYFDNNIFFYKLSKNGHNTTITGDNAPEQNHATNIYVKFKVDLDNALYDNDIEYIIPFIYINNESAPIAKLNTFNFNYTGNYDDKYAIAHISSGKPSINVFDGSFDTSSNLFQTNTDISYAKFSNSWSWDPADVKVDDTLDSRYIVIQNTSQVNSVYATIAFNGVQFEGSGIQLSSNMRKNIDIKDNIKFTNFIIQNYSDQENSKYITEDNFLSSTLNKHTHLNLDSTQMHYLTSGDNSGSYNIQIPYNSLCVLQYNIIKLPEYLPADIYSQTYTITDISDYSSSPTEYPIYRFKFVKNYFEFNSDHDNLLRKTLDYDFYKIAHHASEFKEIQREKYATDTTGITGEHDNVEFESSKLTVNHTTNQIQIINDNISNKMYTYLFNKNLLNDPKVKITMKQTDALYNFLDNPGGGENLQYYNGDTEYHIYTVNFGGENHIFHIIKNNVNSTTEINVYIDETDNFDNNTYITQATSISGNTNISYSNTSITTASDVNNTIDSETVSEWHLTYTINNIVYTCIIEKVQDEYKTNTTSTSATATISCEVPVTIHYRIHPIYEYQHKYDVSNDGRNANYKNFNKNRVYRFYSELNKVFRKFDEDEWDNDNSNGLKVPKNCYKEVELAGTVGRNGKNFEFTTKETGYDDDVLYPIVKTHKIPFLNDNELSTCFTGVSGSIIETTTNNSGTETFFATVSHDIDEISRLTFKYNSTSINSSNADSKNPRYIKYYSTPVTGTINSTSNSTSITSSTDITTFDRINLNYKVDTSTTTITTINIGNQNSTITTGNPVLTSISGYSSINSFTITGNTLTTDTA